MRNREIERFLKKQGAFWQYSSKRREPHAVLTSGKHSDGYFNLSAVFQDPKAVDFLASALVKKLERKVDLSEVTRVISSAMAAILLGFKVAEILGVKFAHCDKINDDQALKRFDLEDNEVIIQIEELITTLGTTKKLLKQF